VTSQMPKPKAMGLIPTRILVYEVNGNIIRARRGVLDRNRAYIGKNEYYEVKPEHLFITTRRKGLFIRRTYYMLAVLVDPVRKISLPPPGNNTPGWIDDEINAAILVRANTMIQKTLKEEREKLLRAMSRTQIVLLIAFIGVIILVGAIYWYNANILMNQINNIITKVFPPPTPAGGGG
jgi:hypothetical protein